MPLGTGDVTFERAKRALRDWRMFSIDWVKLCWPYKKLIPGTVVAVLAHHYGLCSLSAARIVYLVEEPKRFGFACGTLTNNVVRGELVVNFAVVFLVNDEEYLTSHHIVG